MKLTACPFCGRVNDTSDPEVLHPTGTCWRELPDEAIRAYERINTTTPRENWCWSLNCDATAGGCGAQLTGDSESEVIEKWQRRAV